MDEEALYQSLGEAVAARRKQLGLKQLDLAKKIGLSRASVANIEVGRQKIMLHQAFRLAEALDLQSINELVPSVSSRRTEKEPISFTDASDLTATQRAQIESFVRVAKNSVIKKARG